MRRSLLKSSIHKAWVKTDPVVAFMLGVCMLAFAGIVGLGFGIIGGAVALGRKAGLLA
ncbi:MAG TPA: hypothetical protein VHP58_06175 [Alphaproteobacteria bacterium]|nr:hypothetical protein [Alphaproteobacteria bacterium]